MPASVMEVIRKITTDSGITLASIQAGDFGDVIASAANQVEEEFPFEIDEDFPDVSEG